MDKQLQDKGSDARESAMTCYNCHGEMKHALVRFCACDAVPMFIVERVPAKVCPRCGHKSYPGEFIDFLEQVKSGAVLSHDFSTVIAFDYPTSLFASTQQSGYSVIEMSNDGVGTLNENPQLVDHV